MSAYILDVTGKNFNDALLSNSYLINVNVDPTVSY